MRVIQVGLGGFGRSWAEIARATKGVEFVAAVDPSPAARAWAIDALGLEEATVFADLERALDETVTDAVLVITPPDTHHALAFLPPSPPGPSMGWHPTTATAKNAPPSKNS